MIRHTIYYIIYIFGLVFIFQTATVFSQVQTTRVVRSSEKVIINGKLYYIHTVLQGQTIYAISRAYGVTENDITDENPGISIESMNVGDALKIPIKTYIQESDGEDDELDKNDFHYHKVRKGQTLFFISRKYNVPEGIIYRYNDKIKTGLKAGQIIKIPKKKVLQQIIQTIDWEKKFYFYTVSKNDTLYKISEKFGVPVSEIINYNDELRWGINTGQIIKIPIPGVLYIDTLQAIADSITLFMKEYTSFLSAYECDTIQGFKDSIKVALLLPFFTRKFIEVQEFENDTSLITDEYYYEACKRKASIGVNFIEFY
ncbi:MAG: LysM peptidoglycan-binding domain-containing protein, partial [Bacteroidales bacterium]